MELHQALIVDADTVIFVLGGFRQIEGVQEGAMRREPQQRPRRLFRRSMPRRPRRCAG